MHLVLLFLALFTLSLAHPINIQIEFEAPVNSQRYVFEHSDDLKEIMDQLHQALLSCNTDSFFSKLDAKSCRHSYDKYKEQAEEAEKVYIKNDPTPYVKQMTKNVASFGKELKSLYQKYGRDFDFEIHEYDWSENSDELNKLVNKYYRGKANSGSNENDKSKDLTFYSLLSV
ncbi:hypothetical protein O9G_005761, partial [Rozella allomycis CSF55]